MKKILLFIFESIFGMYLVMNVSNIILYANENTEVEYEDCNLDVSGSMNQKSDDSKPDNVLSNSVDNFNLTDNNEESNSTKNDDGNFVSNKSHESEEQIIDKGWNEDKTKYYDGEKYVQGKYFVKEDSSYYYFDAEGIVSRNLWIQSELGKEYYGIDGKQALGKTFILNTFYYFDLNTGLMKTGLQNQNYYNPDGTIYYGQKKIGRYWYYFKPGSGEMAKGIVTIPAKYNKEGSKIVGYDFNGHMLYGLKKVDGYNYYFCSGSGALQTGFQIVPANANNGKEIVAYFETNGKMYIGTKNVGKITISTDNDGSIISTKVNSVPYYAQNDPRWAYNIIGGYYFSGTGCLPTVMTSVVNYYFGTSYTPIEVGKVLHYKGYFNTDSLMGTSSDAWLWAMNDYYRKDCKNNLSYNDIVNNLRMGKLIAGAVGPGTFVNPGYTHAILLFGLNDRGQTYVYDPLHSNRNGWYYLSDIYNQRSTAPEDQLGGGPFYAI